MKIKNSTLLLSIIVAVSCVLRFYNFFELPYTHDELSAIFRTRFSNFSDLIKIGVLPDSHPAGVQVFLYYYCKLFGTSEWIVKVPFAIAGVLSVVLVYLIGRQWYNETVGLIAASYVATLQYTIMYSQVARPYSSGLFFSLLMVWFWTNVIFHPQKRFYINSLFFILSAALCAYNHYFSLLFAAIVGLSGLLFVKREYLAKYILCGLCILVLYLPHLKIFFYQLNLGGPGEWLGKPDNDFLPRYIKYVFQFSIFTGASILIIAFPGFYKLKKTDFNFKLFGLSLAWFLAPFLIGLLYSFFFKGILQYSVLIFGFPFLFFVLFGHLKPQGKTVNSILVVFILVVNSMVLIVERQHYDLFYNSPFEEIMVDHVQASNSGRKTLSIINANSEIEQYYVAKYSINAPYVEHHSFKDQLEFIDFMEKNKDEYDAVFYGCVSIMDPTVIPVILDYFPHIEWERNYSPGDSHLFTKGENSIKNHSVLDFESDNADWSIINQPSITDTIAFSGSRSYFMDSLSEWSPGYTCFMNQLSPGKNDFIDMSVRVWISGEASDISLVSVLEQPDGKVIDWRATPFNTFVKSSNKGKQWANVHHCIKLQDIRMNYENASLKVFVWNRGKRTFYIDDFTIKLRKGNPIIYGIYEKL